MTKEKFGLIELALVLFALGIGGIATVVTGLHVYMTRTAPVLHPDPASVPGTIDDQPAISWAPAADRGRRIVRAAIADRNLPGVSVAVGSRGELVWAEGFGWADLDAEVPVAPSTRFRIGTASMAITSAMVGLLVEDGRLDLEAPIQTWVPEFPTKEWPVTLRHVLAHTSGLRTDAGDEGPFDRHCEQAIDGLSLFARRSLLFEPDTRFRFSSFGWILAGAAIEAAAGEPFLSVVERRVLDPIGMRHTRPDSADDAVEDRATSYFPRYAAEPRHGLHLMRPIDLSCYAGAGVYLSTPSDLVRFGMAMLEGTLLRRSTVERLWTEQRLVTGEPTGWGLGWRLDTVELGGRPTRSVHADGTVLGGTAASLTLFPEHELVVAVVSNISYADTATIAMDLAGAFTAPAPQDP